MLFSLIVANYNNGQYLNDLVKSVLNQTCRDWELLITDDFSQDNSRIILNEFTNLDNRVKVIFHPFNKGAAATFKTAIENASGSIIGMLGADDALVENAIELMINKHYEHPEASLICSNLYGCDENLNIIKIWNDYRQPENWGDLINDPCVGSFATFKMEAYKKSDGFNPYYRKALDHDIYLKLEEKGRVIYFDCPLYLYRANPIGISQNSNWFEASIFSLKARIDAYNRRIKIPLIENLNKEEYHKLLAAYRKKKAILYKMKKKYGMYLAWWLFSLLYPK